MHPKKWPPSVKIGLFLIVIGSIFLSFTWHFSAVIGFLGTLLKIISPVFLGFTIAFIINVPMSKFEHVFERISQKTGKKINPKVTSAICLILSIALVASLFCLLIWFIVPNLIDSVKTAVNSVRTNYPRAITYLENHGFNTEIIENAVASFNPNGLVKHLEDNLNHIIQFSYTAISNVLSSIFMYFTAFILAIYMLANKKTLKLHFQRLLNATVSPTVSNEIQSVLHIAYRCFSNFIAGQCIEAVILGLLFYITLTILSIPYAFLLSVLIAISALVPYVGAFLGFIVGAVMILFIDPFKAMIFAITFIVLQQIEGQLIYPRVVGKSVGLPPVWTLVAVMIGGQVGGVIGMLLFIPLTSIIYTLVKQYIVTKERKKEEQESSKQ